MKTIITILEWVLAIGAGLGLAFYVESDVPEWAYWGVAIVIVIIGEVIKSTVIQSTGEVLEDVGDKLSDLDD